MCRVNLLPGLGEGIFPVAWAVQFEGKANKSTVVLESINDGTLGIWHAFLEFQGH